MQPLWSLGLWTSGALVGALTLAWAQRGRLAALRQAAQDAAVAGAELATYRRLYEALTVERSNWQQQQLAQQGELAALRQAQRSERAQALQGQALLLQAREQLGQHFTLLAQEVLEAKGRTLVAHSEASLGGLLEPLKERLQAFQGRLERSYESEAKERHALQREVQRLAELNQQISADTINLTRALTGDSRTQGAWGELVLTRVLEASGLRAGHEYEAQPRLQRPDGTYAQPDVVINLPEGRHVIVDAKLSLTAYERYVAASLPEERAVARRQHLESLRAHVRLLSDKAYQDLLGVRTLDFVLIFVPLEPALALAMEAGRDLVAEACQKNILLVSPGTLLVTLRTIANLWRQAQQTQNAQAIARQGGALYDKFVALVSDLEEVGRRLQAAQGAYEDAQNKLGRGKNNLIRQVERLRDLGLKPNKQFAAQRLATALSDEAPPGGD